MNRSAAWAFLAASAAALAVYPFVSSIESGVYEGFGLATLGLTVLAIVAYRPANAHGWWVMAAAVFLFACGDIAYGYDGSFPGPADAFYAPAYVAWIVAVWILIRRERFGPELGALIDAGIVTVSVSTAVWILFLDERTPKAAALTRALSWSYVIADLVLLAIVVRAAFLPGRRSWAFWWLVVSIAVMPVADGGYVLPAIQQSWSFGYWTDTLWLASYAAIAVAALDPSMRSMSSAGDGAVEDVVTVRRLYILGASVMTLPVAALVSALWRGFLDTTVLAVVSMAVVIAVTVRVILIVQALHAARLRAEESERRFRMVFERAPIGISVGRDGIMSETNPAFQRMLGYSGEELARMHYTDVTHPGDRNLDVQGQLDSGERDAFSVDKRYVTRAGDVLEAHVHIALDLEDGLGISLVEDVSERRALEEQLREAQRLEAVGKLAGGVAHDFNNLMTAVLGYSGLVLKQLDADDPNREKLEAVQSAASRAGDLTRQLLAFGRRQVLQTEEVDLRDIVARMTDLLGHVLGRAVRLETMLDSSPVYVRVDAAQVEQVVLDLAINAREAMPDGGTLTIGVGAEPGSALLTVADSGAGIDESAMAHIFEPFFTTKPHGEGPGLGLSSVHGIVAQSGGTIDVASAPGAGTVFSVRLPLLPAPVLPGPRDGATLLTD